MATFPWRDFTASKNLMTKLTASKVLDADLGDYYNLAMHEVIESHQWSSRKAEVLVNTENEYKTGTVTATLGSTTITGVSTVWTSSMVGRFIRINDGDTFYKLATFVSATNMTLEKAWPLATATDEDYVIFQYQYAVDATAGDVGTVLFPNESWPMEERSLAWVTTRDPQRRASGGTPVAWIPQGLSSTLGYVVEFWPRFESATSVRIPYYKRIDDLTGTTQPIVRADVIEALALSYSFSHLYTKFGDPHYAKQEDIWEKRYQARLDSALLEDSDRHGLPRSVQAERSYIYDHGFRVSHDVDI